jgi:hypothetical protein
MSESYAVVSISKVEVLLPEPMIPSWDIVYQGIAGGTGKEALDETHTGAAFLKGTTTKVTDQEWTQRVSLVAVTKASLKRTVVFRLMKQSKMTSKRRVLLETSFDLKSLMRSHVQEVMTYEVPDNKGGTVTIKLTCEVMSPTMWLATIRQAKKAEPEEGGADTDSLLSELFTFFTHPSYRDKLLSYFSSKKSLISELLGFLEAYMSGLSRAAESSSDLRSSRKATSSSEPKLTSKQLKRQKKQAEATLEAVQRRKATVTEFLNILLKDALIRKAFIDAEYLQRVIAWSCDPNLAALATAALGSLKPLFSTDPLQEVLGRAGVIHFLIHILNPKTEYGSQAKPEVLAAAMQILPYFSNRFHAVFVKADIFQCIENLLASSVPVHFQHGVELLLILAATRSEEVLNRFLPVFEKSLAHFASEIKDTGEKIENMTHLSMSQTTLEVTMQGVEKLLKEVEAQVKLYADAPTHFKTPYTLKAPEIAESQLSPSMMGQGMMLPSVPRTPPPPPVQRTITPPPPPPPPRRVPARERNAARIDQLSRQVGRLLEDPNADAGEVARLLEEIEQLGTDEPEPEPEPAPTPTPSATPAPPPPPAQEPPRLVLAANVGLDVEDILSFLHERPPTVAHSPPATPSDALHSPPYSSDFTTSDLDASLLALDLLRPSSDPSPLNDLANDNGSPRKVPSSLDTTQKPEEEDTPSLSSSIHALDQMTSALDMPISPRKNEEKSRSPQDDAVDSDSDNDTRIKPQSTSGGLRDSRSRLKRSMNRLTQEMSQLEAVADLIDGNGEKVGGGLESSAPGAQPEPDSLEELLAHLGGRAPEVPPETDGDRMGQSDLELLLAELAAPPEPEPETSSDSETPPIETRQEKRRRIRRELESGRAWSELDYSDLDLSSSLSDEDLSDTGSSTGSLVYEEEPGVEFLLRNAHNIIPVPPAPPAPGARRRRSDPPMNRIQEGNISHTPAPVAPTTEKRPLESPELIKLRVRMAELERLASAPLQPILRLSGGQEARYLHTTIVQSLLVIMTHCTSIKLKAAILELVGKLSKGHTKDLMQIGYLDAVLSLASSFCSQKPQLFHSTLPATIRMCFELLNAPEVMPQCGHITHVLRLFKLPISWWSGLHESLLKVISQWDLYTVGPQYPGLMHACGALIDSLGNPKLVTSTLLKFFTPPNVKQSETSSDVSSPLPKSHVLLLSRMLRDPLLISKWLGSIQITNASTNFLPFVEIILNQKMKLTKADTTAFDDAAKEVLKSGVEKMDKNPPAKAEVLVNDAQTEKAEKLDKKPLQEIPRSLSGKRRHSRVDSNSSKSSKSSASSSSQPSPAAPSSSAVISQEEFTLAQLLDGAIGVWGLTQPIPMVRANLGSLVLKYAGTMVEVDTAASEKRNFFKVLGRLPYLNEMVITNPKSFLPLINNDNLGGRLFPDITEVFLSLSSDAIAALCYDAVATAYLQKLEAIKNAVTNRTQILALVRRFCLEGRLWHCAIHSNQTQSLLFTLASSLSDIGLEMIHLISPEETEYLPLQFFDIVVNNVKNFLYKVPIALEMFGMVKQWPIFWRYVAVVGSTIQESLIRIFYGESREKYSSEFKTWAKELLESEHCLEMSKKGFLLNALRIVAQAGRDSLSNFLMLLISADTERGYRLLRLTVLPSVDHKNKTQIPEEAAKLVTNALANSGIKTVTNDWEQLYSTSHVVMDWSRIPVGAPIAVVGYTADGPSFGGVIPRLPKVLPSAPLGTNLPAVYAYSSGPNTIRITDPSIRIFYKEAVAKPTMTANTAVILHEDSINFVEALKLTFMAPLNSRYNPHVYAYNSKVALPAEANSAGITRVAIYSAPLGGTSNISAMASLAIDHQCSTAVIKAVQEAMRGLAAHDTVGAEVVSKALTVLSAQFDASDHAELTRKLVRDVASPGYAISTQWKPILGSTTLGTGAESVVLKASGCFAAFSEPLKEKQVALWRLALDEPPVPLLGPHLTASSAPLTSSSSPSSGASSSIPKPPPLPGTLPLEPSTFTHFLISMTPLKPEHQVPDGIVVFTSESPIPMEEILKVEINSAEAARKAKWAIPPTSVISLTTSPESAPKTKSDVERAPSAVSEATGAGLEEGGNEMPKAVAVRRSPLVTIAVPSRANYLLVVGFAAKDTILKESVIYSVVLLGTTKLPVVLPRFEHVVQFFKGASIVTSSYLPPNEDLQGVIHYIGTEMGHKAWTNPYDANTIGVTLSHPLFRAATMKIGNIVGRDPVPTYWGTKLPVWFTIDLQKHTACPTHFALRHGYEQDNSFIQNWELQASHDKKTWKSVFSCKETTHTKSFETVLYTIPEPVNDFYRYWRVITHSNYWLSATSSGNPMMCCTGFDLFGYISAPL